MEDYAFQNRILLWALSVLWGILAALVGTHWVKSQKRADAMDAWKDSVSDAMARIETEVQHIREWRHEMAGDEHRAMLQELTELRTIVRKKADQEGETE